MGVDSKGFLFTEATMYLRNDKKCIRQSSVQKKNKCFVRVVHFLGVIHKKAQINPDYMEMKDNIDSDLLYRYWKGECSLMEQLQIEAWLKMDNNHDYFESMKMIWEVEPRKELSIDVDAGWERLESKMHQSPFKNTKVYSIGDKKILSKQSLQKSRSILPFLYRIAAVLVLGFSLSLIVAEYFNRMDTSEVIEVAMREVVTNRAHKAQLTFSDGTKVVLSADSRITFPERFSPEIREVYMEGEAYFEVAQLDGIEFIVHTPDARVQVLGTEFNVKARKEANSVEVVVAGGKVSVRSNIESDPADLNDVILTKGQMTTVQSGRLPLPASQINVDQYLAWTRGHFVFVQTPLSEIIAEWERQYDVNITVRDTSLLSTTFTGEYRNESLNEMLRLTALTLGFNFHRDGPNIIIVP